MLNHTGGLEDQLFEWDFCDEGVEPEDGIFCGVKLVVPIGKFSAGHKFSFCNYMPSEGLVEFFDNKEDQDGHVFRLKLTAESINA